MISVFLKGTREGERVSLKHHLSSSEVPKQDYSLLIFVDSRGEDWRFNVKLVVVVCSRSSWEDSRIQNASTSALRIH